MKQKIVGRQTSGICVKSHTKCETNHTTRQSTYAKHFRVHRHFKLEAELASMSWRVRWEDIEFERAHRRQVDAPTAVRARSRSLTQRHALCSACFTLALVLIMQESKKNFADHACEQDFLLDRTKTRNKQQKGDVS